MRPMEFIQSIDRSNLVEELKHDQAHDPHAPLGDLAVKQLQEETIRKQTSVNHAEAEEEIHPDDKKKDNQERRSGTSEKNQENSDPVESREPDKGSHLDLLG